MIPYFQGGCDEAKLYTSGSSKKIYPVCPDCGRVKDKPTMISYIKKLHGIGCNCANSNSYPNKFIFQMLEQLKINFEPEKVFEWAKFARYDFYFKHPINMKEYIIEADGRLGHGNFVFSQKKEDLIETEYLDFRKDMIAKKHSCIVIRIDCKESDKEYISNNIINSQLSDLFDLNTIDWDKCDIYATSNIVKEVCELYNKNIDVNNLSEQFKLNKTTIRKYLHRGTKLGWCNYNSKENMLKAGRQNGFNNARPILIYDRNNNFICEVKSITFLIEHSNEIINTTISQSTIILSCKTGKMAKGFYFRYKDKEYN